MKRILPLFAALLLPFAAPARPVTEAEAATAAANWLARSPRPMGAKRLRAAPAGQTAVRAVRDGAGDALFHVVRLPEGGFVVTSAETGVEPVVAFADADDLDESPENPLYAILVADMASRTAQARGAQGGARVVKKAAAPKAGPSTFDDAEASWEALLEGPARNVKRAGSRDSVQDVRVAPLIETAWGQGDGAADYYTPNGYVCGCVALAGAQIARFWRFPTASRPTVTRTCYVSGSARSFTTKGGTYAWSLMPETFDSLSDAQCEAIGRLCYDFGVATYMSWDSGGSGTGGYCLDDAFTTVFGYANSRTYVESYRDAFTRDVIERTILANLDAGCPVSLGIRGHMIDADGYGYSSGTLYTHLNLGWNGSYDAWYNLPTVDTWYSSSVLDEVVYNIFPRKTGDLLTGRVLDQNGSPIAGAEVSAGSATATTDAKGIYALWVEGGSTWTVTARSGSLSASRSVYVEQSVSTGVSGRGYSPGTGTPGNSWGNDIQLSGTVSSAPLAPAWVDASDGDYSDKVAVAWGASWGATSYEVWRATSATGTKTSLGTTSATGWNDTTAAAGTTYHYWVKASNSAGTSGFGGPDTGYRAAAPARPGNDDFANAWVLSGASGSTTGSSVNATRESGEPIPAGSAACSVWWRWTAPGDGTASFETAGSSFDTVMGVYSGSSVSSLAALDSNDDYGSGSSSRCEWTAESGKTYFVQVAGYYESDAGSVCLSWSFSPAGASSDFPAGLDAEQLAWTTSDAYPWEFDGEVSSDGVDSARSHGIAGYDTSWAQTTVTGPANVSFVYRKNFYSASFAVTVDGATVHEDTENCHADTTWYSVSFSVGSGTHAIRLAYTHNGTGWCYEHNGVWVDRFVVSSGSAETATWYVDAAAGSDSAAGTSWGTARRTIQSAVDSASDGDTVLVADGTYGPVSTAKILEIRSVNGAARTIVDGGGTRPCAVFGYGNTRDDPGRGCRVVGFTFQNGYADGAYTHAGVQYGHLENCIVRWNSGDGYGSSCGIAEATARNCLVYGNEFRSDWGGGSACWGDFYNCTIVDNEGYGVWDSRCWNSIVRGNGGGDVYTSWDATGNSMNRCCLGGTAGYENDGCFRADPLFADADAGDYRLAAGSPCIDAGNGSYVDTAADLDGAGRVFGDAVDIGCFEYRGGSAPSRPANDDFADAWALSGASGSTRGSNVGATRESSAEPPSGVDWGSVWWAWTAPGDGTVAFDTRGSGFDTGLAVYTGSSVGSLGSVASNDDYDWEDTWSRCEFEAEAGTVYRISVGSYRGERGDIVLNWSWTPSGGGGGRPDNDDFANARTLSGPSGSASGSNEGATREDGEPAHAGRDSLYTVWWVWTAPGDGTAFFHTEGSDFDTVLAVYRGSSLASLSEVASNDDGCSDYCSRCEFRVTAGTTYRIAVGGYSDASGSISLAWSWYESSSSAPASPSWVSASDGCDGCVYVQWDWSPGASHYDVYRSESFDGYREWIGSADWESFEDWGAEPETTYWYWVTASNDAGTSDFGPYDSGWRTASSGYYGPPANDDFADAWGLSGRSGTYTGWNVNATLEPGEPEHWTSYENGSVWWSWTAPAGGTAVFDTVGSSFDTVMAVYTGGSLGSLSQVAANDDADGLCSRCSFAVSAGRTYRIAVAGYCDEGQVVLNWRLYDPYRVRFDANGGTGSMPEQTILREMSTSLRANAFARPGYVFIGWARTPGGAVAYRNGASVLNLAAAGGGATLYAKWAKKKYKVKFCHTYKGETGKMKAQTFAYGTGKRLRANKFKREGYKFKGWATSKARAKKGKVKYKNKKKVKNLTATGKTVKLYATWKKK